MFAKKCQEIGNKTLNIVDSKFKCEPGKIKNFPGKNVVKKSLLRPFSKAKRLDEQKFA